MTEFAGYLPGLSADEIDWQSLNFDRGNERVEVAVPVLSEVQLSELAATVKQASRTYLKSLTVSQIIAIIDKAIARLLDRNDPYRQKAERLLPLITGYDSEMVRLGLTQYLKTFRRSELHKFLAEDFANPGILDDFQPMPKGGFAKALGPDLLVVADHVIGRLVGDRPCLGSIERGARHQPETDFMAVRQTPRGDRCAGADCR